MMRRLLLSTALMTAVAAPALAQDFSKADIEKIIHEYIMNNPQVMIDSVNAYEVSRQNEQHEQAMEIVKANADWIYKNKTHGIAGNPNGDLTIVEFFDYNCGYCKQAMNDLMTLLDEDKKLKLIFIDVPILGESSYLAARWSMAVQAQDKFLEFHVPLMRHRGAINEAVLENYARAAGVDMDRLKKDLEGDDINRKLDENLAKSREFGITGTPAFILGENMIRGYVGIDGMRKVLTDARAK